jgi:pimeloyl-ACP methyl ester carboxylesterase
MTFLHAIGIAYLAFTVLSILLIVYKELTSNWRVDRRMKKISPEKLSWNVPAERASRRSIRIRIVLVHGTWAIRGDWHQPDSRFLRALKAEIAKAVPGCETDICRFLWSGGNTVTDRARALARFKRQFPFDASNTSPPAIPTFVVGHSHGGNIAVNALNDCPSIFEKVSAVVTVATPFLVSHKRRAWMAILMGLMNGVLLSAIGTVLVLDLLDRQPSGSIDEIGIFSLGVLVLTGTSIWQRARVSSSMLGAVTRQGLSRKLVVMRASGDEAGAALGVGYIVGYAARTAAKIIAAIASLPVRGFEAFVKGESDDKPNIWLELCQFALCAPVALLLLHDYFLPEPALPNFTRDSLSTSAQFVAGAFVGWGALSVVYSWLRRTAGGAIRAVVHSVLETLVAGCLIPFGPETSIAAPFLIVSAEAVPPTQGAVSDAVPVIQLPFRDVPIQHSFETHAEDIAQVTAGVIANSLGGRALNAPSDPRGARASGACAPI